MLIRQETFSDHSEVYTLVQAAFAKAEHSDGSEQELVEALRKSPAFVPALSLVAQENEILKGYILFTEIKAGTQTALALAPLAVQPDFQRQGIGSALVREGHRRAAALGYNCSVVLGSEHYYPRFGYVPAEALGIQTPKGFPPASFMALFLRKGIHFSGGPVTYAPEFGL